jgi:hypothetical protein
LDKLADFTDSRRLLGHKLISVGNTQVEAKVGASLSQTVEELFIYNDSTNTIYWGLTGVSTSGTNKGFPLSKGTSVTIPTDSSTSIFLIAASGTNNVIVAELGS